jgi:metallo-beta-lactamase family protein
LRNNIEDPSTTVLIVGYMAEDTLGRKLVEKYHEVKIFGRRIPVRAEVQTLNLFSSHADYNDIVKWVKELDLKRLRKIFLVHGEAKALGSLRGKLLDAGVKAVDITRSGQRYRLRS